MHDALRGSCSIYSERPEICRVYPRASDWRPVRCAYTFGQDGTRSGECRPEACGADNCCNFPRGAGSSAGEPTATFESSGLPCRHLTGLNGSRPRPAYAQAMAHALWVGPVVLTRLALDLWSVSRVRERVVLWTVEGFTTEALRGRVHRGRLTLKLEPEGQERLFFSLTPEETVFLWTLTPAAQLTQRAIDV